MESKPWWKSKTIWSDILTIFIGLYESISLLLAPHFGWNLPQVPSSWLTFLGAIGIYGRATSTTTIDPNILAKQK